MWEKKIINKQTKIKKKQKQKKKSNEKKTKKIFSEATIEIYRHEHTMSMIP